MTDWHNLHRYGLGLYGKPRSLRVHGEKPIGDMLAPVECAHCGAVYDLGSVEVTARYVDCSVWTSPCCKRPGCDDRGGGLFGKSLVDIHRVDRNGHRTER